MPRNDIPIPNNILEALCRTKLSGDEYSVILAIIRLHNGCTYDDSQSVWKVIAKVAGIVGKSASVKVSVCRVLTNLQTRNILSPVSDDSFIPYIVNPNTHDWNISRSRNNGTTFTRAKLGLIYSKTNGKCAYCECPIEPFGNWQVDHVVPLCQGGTDELSNLVPSCPTCNCLKSGRTPEQWKGVESNDR
jgi:hypothetical protein